MKKKPSLESRLRRKHTKVTVRDRGTYKQFIVWLTVGCQSFVVTGIPCDDKQEAEWFRTMLAKALVKIVEENK